MSNFLDCCLTKYQKNSTDLNPFYSDYTVVNPDGSTSHPLEDCNTAPVKIFPFTRGDTSSLCNDISNPCLIAPWPSFPPQTFEALGLMTGVTFTYSGTTITATKNGHGLTGGGEAFRIYGQTGNNSVLNSSDSWSVATIPDGNTFTFTISTEPSGALSAATLDFREQKNQCVRGTGYRGAIANRRFNGRYGFTDDDNANPKISQKYGGYHVGIALSEDFTSSCTNYDPDTGAVTAFFSTGWSNSGSADSQRNITAWGVEVCQGTSGAGDGSAYSEPSDEPKCFNVGGACYVEPLGRILEVPSDPCAHPDGGFGTPSPEDARAANKIALQNLCAIDSRRSVVTIPVPFLGTYTGPLSGFYAWVTGNNSDTTTSECFNQPLPNWSINDQHQSSTYTVSGLVLSNTKISGAIDFVMTYQLDGYQATHNEDGTCTKGAKTFSRASRYTYSFGFSASLSGAIVFSDLENDAKGLLNNWNMADDSIWDNTWLQGDCSILPMVSRREVNGAAPGVGYCEAPSTDYGIWQLNQSLAYYDGSVVGAPLSTYKDANNHYYPNAFYDQGWFDWTAEIYHYTDNGDGTSQLCYTYGKYMVNGLPSQATQFPEGAADTSDLGPGWSPFSRFKYNYVLAQMPPFVLGGGAYLAGSNATDVYVSKIAEVKMPLPSQNFWQPTSVQPNQAALDNFASWSATPMRDLNILDGTCTDTGTKRYPDAVPIAGRAAVMFHDNGGTPNTFNALGIAPQLKEGDSVDFITASNAVVATYSVDSIVTGGFKFVGYVPTGAKFMVSHGHAGDWQWFDISPHGDFVLSFFKTTLSMSQDSGGAWIQNYTSENTAEQRNVRPDGVPRAIIAICPPNSPELADGRWNGANRTANVNFFTGYPSVEPMDSWRCVIQQGMSDRFWIQTQDNQHQENTASEDDPPNLQCVSSGLTVPQVEARLTAPIGAPLKFDADSANRWNKMPAQDSFGIGCSGIWNYGTKKLAYTKSLDAVQTPNIAGAGDASMGAGDMSGGGL
jgi:hypothetical protein